MKIVFLGTPEFGVDILNALVLKHEVVLVVTQQDKLVGRKQVITAPPVKVRAQELGIEVFQPASIRKEYEYIINNFEYDLIVSAAYGQIVGMKLLNSPKYRSINVHASLLPKGRGGAPIQRAIMNGDKETGISIMYMEKGMDTGDVLAQEKMEILDTDTKESLFKKLGALGAKMINDTIDKIEKGDIHPIKQDDNLATYTYALTKEDEILDFNKEARLVSCQVRGLGEIGATFKIDDVSYKIYSVEVINKEHNNKAGEIIDVTKKYFDVACKQNIVRISEIKPEGKNLMKVSDFINGKGRNILIKSKIIG